MRVTLRQGTIIVKLATQTRELVYIYGLIPEVAYTYKNKDTVFKKIKREQYLKRVKRYKTELLEQDGFDTYVL